MRMTLVVLAILTVVCLSPSAASETGACAHRGDVSVAPENTIPAFESAVRKNAPMIEFDVYVTKDERLIIIHDSTVDRTTNAKGKVTDFTFEEIRKLDAGSWFNAKFADTKIPTLRETLDAIPNTVLCNVHLKKGHGLAAKTAKVIAEMGHLDHCFLACTVEQIEEARKVVPGIKTCNMSRQGGNRKAYIDTTIKASADFIQLYYRNGAEGLKEDVKLLHDRGVTINWYGANEEDLMRTLASAGVDYVLTDKLDLCMKVLKEGKL